MLGSILAQDRYLPRQLHTRGDRLAFSNGIVFLALAAIAFVVAFGAEVTALIQLYIVGVFVSFTLSQIGMVRHWTRLLRIETDPAGRRRMQRSRVINTIGLVMTGTVLVVVLITKFLAGAWIAIVAMSSLFVLMKLIHQHYATVQAELDAAVDERRGVAASRNHAVVLVSKLHLPTLRALAYARATRPDTLEAITVNVDDRDTRKLVAKWEDSDITVPLKVIASPYREITRPVARLREADPPGITARRGHGVHPRVRRRSLVGADPAQPERAAAQGPAAVRAERDGDVGSVAAQFVGASQGGSPLCRAGGDPARRRTVMVPAPVRCDVTGLAHGGAGVARIDGRVVFVAGALPGDGAGADHR